MERKEIKKKTAHSMAENLWYQLKSLYGESPGFVWLYAVGVVFAIGISLLGVYMPSVLVADITAGAAMEELLGHLALLGGGLVCLYVGNSFVEQTKKEWNTRLCYGRSLKIARASMEAEYFRIENAAFEEEFWQQLRRSIWENTYTTEFMQAFSMTVQALIGMILYLGMLSGLSFWILVPVLAGTGISYLTAIRCNRWDAANRHKWMALDNKTHYLAQDLGDFQAAKDVRLYGMAPWLKSMYDGFLRQRIRYTVRQQGNYFLESFMNGVSRLFWEGAAYLYLIWLVCEGRLDAAGFVLYFGVITGFAAWCSNIVNGMRKLHQNSLYVEEARGFFQRLQGEEEKMAGPGGQEAEETGSPGKGQEELVIPPGHIPEISFDHVTFRYGEEGEPVIRDLNLTLQAGENIALVGLNGAGKTTFIKLLCGFYDPTEGEILIDGVNRNRYTRASWLKIFSGVFQDVGLFPLSLKENLVPWGQADAALLKRCLGDADLEDVIGKLPGGLESMIGIGVYEEAVDFSGGEMQKLMLARALYRQAPLLVLDEPTAALDPLMESQLYERYRHFSADRTTVFISHRLASTRFCDRILLMEEGKVTESGSHEELLAADGRYAWMFRLQSRYYRQKEEGLADDMGTDMGDWA